MLGMLFIAALVLFAVGLVFSLPGGHFLVALGGAPFMLGKMKVLEIKKGKRGHGINSQDIYEVQQALVRQAFGMSLSDMIDKDMQMEAPLSESGVSSITRRSDIKQAFKISEMNEAVKQTMLTSSGTEAFMLNDAAAGFFGSSTGVFNPGIYAHILEGNALTTLLPKLWGLQPFAENDLSTKLIYFVKTDPFNNDGTPTFARAAESRAGSDIGFQVKAENVDAQRYIVHLPYSMELQKVLQGRLGLDAKVMETFNEAATYRDEYWGFLKWYEALTLGTLEGKPFALYTDGVIANVLAKPDCYTAYYDVNNGCIKGGDSTSYAAATTHTSSGADLFDLIIYVESIMSGDKTPAGNSKSYRYQWVPEYVVVPQMIANKLVQEYKDGNLLTVWISQNDIPMYKDETHFLCRLNLGNKGVDVWVMPTAIMNNLPASVFTTTDSAGLPIMPMFFGRYMGMAAIAPASPLLFFIDDGYEAVTVNNVTTLRRNMTKVQTMFQLKSEMMMNCSQSFVVKVVQS
jgi:hypothetical protein